MKKNQKSQEKLKIRQQAFDQLSTEKKSGRRRPGSLNAHKQ